MRTILKEVGGTLVAIAILVLGFWMAMGVAYAQEDTRNQVSDWCDQGVKLEPVSTPFVVPEPPEGTTWSLLVLKAGTQNTVVSDPLPGASYVSESGQEISHVILCYEATNGSTTTSTTTSSSTSTTTPTSTTTTDPTTTTSSSVPPSTTTTVSSSTSSTSAVTTSTVPPTTSTHIDPTPTTETVPPPIGVNAGGGGCADGACEGNLAPWFIGSAAVFAALSLGLLASSDWIKTLWSER